MSKRTLVVLGVLLSQSAWFGHAAAQEPADLERFIAAELAMPPPEGTTGRSMAARIAAGTAGSAAGLSLGVALGTADLGCADDWACALTTVAVGGAVASTVGSVIGVEVAAGLTDEEPNTSATVVGAALGVLAGALAGFGLSAGTGGSSGGFVIGYALTQGAIAAMASAQR